MKAHDGRHTVDRIVSTRSRLRFGESQVELAVRLTSIRNSYNQLDPAIDELLRYYPIALAACLESWFRLAIRELIDSGDPYLENARQVLKKKAFDYDILVSLHGQTITIGEVISHYLPVSKLSHIIATMNSVMGEDFRRRVSEVHDRWEVEIKKQPSVPIVANIDETFRNVDRTFELRHIFCHEAGTAVKVGCDEIEQCINHTATFLRASDEMISQTLFPDAPLTQTAMNIASYEDYEKEREGLDLLVETITSVLSNGQKERFTVANEAWKTFLDASVEIDGLQYEGGTMRPTVEALVAKRLVRDRKAQLKELLGRLEATPTE
ncbi:MAG: hypothetical protein OXT72_14670 [Gammaproteobacteria bacterium]|nr:hypothetical protein [Gammaproteobacteria bacterium]MDE0249037.1 hypothetical protein [Gammaproteobacteria bacterium]